MQSLSGRELSLFENGDRSLSHMALFVALVRLRLGSTQGDALLTTIAKYPVSSHPKQLLYLRTK
jgi:hypothetical protein